MILRPYQLRAIEALRGALSDKDRALCVLPTGSGKTIIFNEILKLGSKNRGFKATVLMNKKTLVEQTARVIGDRAGVFCASLGEKNLDKPITVASIQSIMSVKMPEQNLIIVDEAHNMTELWAEFLKKTPAKKIIGFTATPFTASGMIYGQKDSFWPKPAFELSMKEMIECGFLVRPTMRSIVDKAFDISKLTQYRDDYKYSEVCALVKDEKKVQAQVEDAMIRLELRAKVVWACASIEHALMVKDAIPELCSVLHSKQGKAEARINKKAFESGHARHMVSVVMLSEGYDYPAIDAVVFMRPTRSPRLYVQTVGRGLRVSEGKGNCLVLDYGRVVEHCGPVTAPVIIREKTGIAAKKQSIEIEMMTKLCTECLAVVNLTETTRCPECDHDMSKEGEWLKGRIKSLTVVHKPMDIMERPTTLQTFPVREVLFSQHKARSGNDCIKIIFYCEGRFTPVQQYISSHPYSWNKGKKVLGALAPWEFETFEEAYEHIGQIEVENIPESITVKVGGEFEEITRVRFRSEDSGLSGTA